MSEKFEILIVDDRKENLVALRRVLCEVDAEIVEATTGNEALAATLNHDFALAILDVQMPGMSGYELAEHLRGDKKTQMIPIVFVTAAYADEEHRFLGYEAGAVDYLTKPYSPEVMRSKVNIFLEMARYRRELELHRDHLETLVAERTGQLNERVKELKCLYAISSLVEKPRESIDETLSFAVSMIPPGWLYPEITRARIVFEGREFASEGFRETPWKLSADIVVAGKKLGSVEVCYLEERPVLNEGPFLKEEQDLIIDIGRQLSVMIKREQAEAELKESEKKFRSYIECAPDGVFIVDDTGQYLEVNKAACRIMGYSKEELEKMSIRDLLDKESLKDGLAHFKKILKTGAARSDLWHKRKDGLRCYLTVDAVKLSEKTVLGFAKDITDRKNDEEILRHTLESLRDAVRATIQVIISTVEARDPYTANHQLRSADLASAIATEMKFPEDRIEGIRIAASIHDLGKLSVPAEILSKPTELTKIEFSLVKEHPEKGYNILKNVESSWPLAEIIYQHHERIDGSGYPRNLKGDEILMEARILAVCDVVESMTSHRPYRAALGIDAALQEIENNRGILYDADVADVCLKLFRKKGYKLE